MLTTVLSLDLQYYAGKRLLFVLVIYQMLTEVVRSHFRF